MVGHGYNHSSWKTVTGETWVEASLSYIATSGQPEAVASSVARPYLKTQTYYSSFLSVPVIKHPE